MNGLTAADFADTGQWRLIVKLFDTGLSAHLENTLHPDIPPQPLFSTLWEAAEESLLSHIENAVYDHPRILDDFSAKIIVFDMHTLFFPSALLEEEDGAEEAMYAKVYEVEGTDVMTDEYKGITAAFSPAPGLKGFLSRTFPGARIENNLMEQMRRRHKKADGKKMYLSIRENEADFILFDSEQLLSASTHPLTGTTDIAYHALNIINVYDLKASDVEIISEGMTMPEEVKTVFRKMCKGVKEE